MRDRVRQFGGELIISRAEPGTLVEAKIPLFGLDFGPNTQYKSKRGWQLRPNVYIPDAWDGSGAWTCRR
jgi:hypothetical protein